VIEKKKQWLVGHPWDSVLSLNRSLCQAQKLEPILNPKTIAAAKQFWDRSAGQMLTLAKALELCRKTFELLPLTFNNGNTFAAIGRSLVEDYLQMAPPVESQIIRTTIGHYIAGTIERKELIQVLEHFDHVLKAVPTLAAPPAALAPAPAPEDQVRLAEPRAAV
jgi:hypothetical protein